MSLTNLMNVEEISYTFFAETKPNSVEIDKPPTKMTNSIFRSSQATLGVCAHLNLTNLKSEIEINENHLKKVLYLIIVFFFDFLILIF